MSQYRTRIKVCGITRPDQADFAISLGVDAIGMIMHADSPRTITIDQARLIRRKVPAFVTLVGVFVDATSDYIERCIETVGLDLLQLHGNETQTFADRLSRPYIKAIRAKTREQVVRDSEQFESARAILLDPYVKGQHGGTGQSLASDLWPSELVAKPLILAGGLSAANLADRIKRFSPFAVDLNSGVEIKPGDKDSNLLSSAVSQVRQANVS